MFSVSMKNVAQASAGAALTFLLWICLTSQASSHAIGGSLNTDFDLKGSQSAHWFLTDAQWREIHGRRSRSAWASHGSRHQLDHPRRHDADNRVGYDILGETAIDFPPRFRLRARRDTSATASGSNNRPASFLRPKKVSTDARKTVSGPASTTNPFLRVRRSIPASNTCSLPANLPAQVRELNSFLADSDYLSVMPEQGDFIPLPTGQPRNSCPAATGSWWPRREINLRSTCPWTWEELDNGPDAYPRYIRQAKCMCQKCIDSTINRCHEIRQDVTIFRLTGCQDGLAVMQKTEVTVTLGCFCAAPEPNTRAGRPECKLALHGVGLRL